MFVGTAALKIQSAATLRIVPQSSEAETATAIATSTYSTAAVAANIAASITADTKLAAQSITATSAATVVTITVAVSTGQILTYDLDANMTSDGVNTYSWDAENRFVSITYWN